MSPIDRLRSALSRHNQLTIAVSGGVDSMTLAHIAHQSVPSVTIVHAMSPAVPGAATDRVKRHSERWAWLLKIVDAGEFGDPRYRANPVDRCYFCKLNLYSTIRALTKGPVAAGTNTDDLGDYRPGLTAASELDVLHPYVEARIDKAGVYDLADALGLSDLAALPAQPCLASRIETAIPVAAADLRFIETAEADMRGLLGEAAVVRCRITHLGVIVEAGDNVDADAAARVTAELCAITGRSFAGSRPYRQGAAFLRGLP